MRDESWRGERAGKRGPVAKDRKQTHLSERGCSRGLTGERQDSESHVIRGGSAVAVWWRDAYVCIPPQERAHLSGVFGVHPRLERRPQERDGRLLGLRRGLLPLLWRLLRGRGGVWLRGRGRVAVLLLRRRVRSGLGGVPLGGWRLVVRVLVDVRRRLERVCVVGHRDSGGRKRSSYMLCHQRDRV